MELKSVCKLVSEMPVLVEVNGVEIEFCTPSFNCEVITLLGILKEYTNQKLKVVDCPSSCSIHFQILLFFGLLFNCRPSIKPRCFAEVNVPDEYKNQNQYLMNEEITLQFRTLDDLWAFRIEAMVTYVAIDNNRNVLTCRCGRNHIELALSKYNAQVVVIDKSEE